MRKKAWWRGHVFVVDRPRWLEATARQFGVPRRRFYFTRTTLDAYPADDMGLMGDIAQHLAPVLRDGE